MSTAPDPLRDLYKSLTGRGALPLEPDDPYYQPILQATPERDPILMLWQRLDWAESESVHLLTGFRGNGKSTELRRLRRLLQEQSGARVFLVNMADVLLLTKPPEISDFVLSLMTALARAVEAEGDLKALSRGYWERLQRFLTSEVAVEGLEIDLTDTGAPAKFGLRLKNEPDFKARMQAHLRGHLGRLLKEARTWVTELVRTLREQARDPDLKVVLLVDSVEQIRGVGTDAQQVHDSVVNLFAGHGANRGFPLLHVVYTIPPFLIALAQNLGRTLGGHAIVSWPNIHVRHADGAADPAGLAVMERIIDRRHPDWAQIIPPATLRRLGSCAGGDLRDFFRLIGEAVIALRTARLVRPEAALDDALIRRVEEQLRNDLMPIAKSDASALASIHTTKAVKHLPPLTLARFFDNNLVMNYLRECPWYDVHPLLIEELKRLVPDPDPEPTP